MRLSEYLDQSERKRWAWGSEDCALWPANWALALTGRDPAAKWRESYSDRAGADAVIAAAGGTLALVKAGLEETGWVETLSPEDGDIGVLEGILRMSVTGPVEGQIAAVRDGNMWVVRAARGLRWTGVVPHLAAWHACQL